MPRFFRKISKAKWYQDAGLEWLRAGELQADALNDLRTNENELSLFLIEDGDQNLERVVAAVASTGKSLRHVDYAELFSEELEGIDIRPERSDGETHDQEVNRKWHFDARKLSAEKILALAHIVGAPGTKRARIPEAKVIEYVRKAVSDGFISRDALDEKVRRHIPTGR